MIRRDRSLLAVLAVLVTGGLAATAGASAPPAGTMACGSAGLNVRERQSGAILEDKVTHLEVSDTSCKVARAVARRIARTALNYATVPVTDGFTVTMKPACAHCPTDNVYPVSAVKGDERITFTMLGGV